MIIIIIIIMRVSVRARVCIDDCPKLINAGYYVNRINRCATGHLSTPSIPFRFPVFDLLLLLLVRRRRRRLLRLPCLLFLSFSSRRSLRYNEICTLRSAVCTSRKRERSNLSRVKWDWQKHARGECVAPRRCCEGNRHDK